MRKYKEKKPRGRPWDSVTFLLKRSRRRRLDDPSEDRDTWRETTVTSYGDTPSSSIGLTARGVTSSKMLHTWGPGYAVQNPTSHGPNG